jgi:hypothetical protein
LQVLSKEAIIEIKPRYVIPLDFRQNMDIPIPNEIIDLCTTFLRGLNAILGEKLYGVYLYGAIAFPDKCPIRDIDFHAIIKSGLNDKEKSDLTNLHADLAQDFPPLGAELDGYYILLEEARQTSPPRHQLLVDVLDSSWALHREHIRAGRRIVLQGPDPKQVYPPASWPELEYALQEELDYVENHLDDYPDYCVLNLCRLVYSFDTRDVVISKLASAEWAWVTLPEWRSLIDAARKSYQKHATTQDKRLLEDKVRAFFGFACRRIQENNR